MKKRWTAALLALALTAGLLRGTASAAQTGEVSVRLGTAYAAQDAVDGLAGSRLAGVDREVYRILKEEVAKIADGTRSSTVIRIPNLSALSWTLSELGADGDAQSAVLAKLKARFAQTLHMDRVYSALSADCPYELYWRDLKYSWDCVQARRGNRAAIEDITIRIQVAEAYRDGSETIVDARKVEAAKRAADNARAIVEQYRDRTDYEKLTAYREEICRLVSYDTASASSDVPYGDPWQLVYVFDGDQTTNVVCEGYAKAFQYLCDLSEFSGDVACYTVSGRMNGGGHMWNVVRMEDGKNYLVDVTNCDAGTSGAPDKLFLAGGQGTDGGRTQTVALAPRGAVYTYSEEQEDLFTSGWLGLSGKDYEYDPAAQLVAGFTDVKRGEYCADAVAWAVKEKITKGTSETTFSPEDPCTHAEILTFLWRAEGQPEGLGQAPEGAGPDAFFYEPVRWADGLGMVSAAEFDPDAPCDRADAVTYIWAAFGWPEAPASGFIDVPEGASYAPAVDWAVEREVTKGTTEETFGPGDGCSRGNIVTLLYRAYH